MRQMLNMRNLQSILSQADTDGQRLVILYIARVRVASIWQIKDSLDWSVKKAQIICSKLTKQDVLTEVGDQKYTLRRVVK